MAIFPLDTIRINPGTYSGRSATLPNGSKQSFPTYARALAAGSKEIQPNYITGPISTTPATADTDTSAQDFIQDQIKQVKDASGLMNPYSGAKTTSIPTTGGVTPGTQRNTPKAVTNI